ncbi:MAG: 1,4-alpha-glucan branching protein GlgB [Methylobacteriaceae bacterium]|nr:1,4-alpha-glucan branching protein GlgB [Methylobacteriaceae bacterium]MBV9246943.1 1,4-alpha-glucan branching protein GlgB [Methylobacteriaceae bacterium]
MPADWRTADEDVAAILAARQGDPFGVLGPQETGAGLAVRAFVPGAERLIVLDPEAGKTIALERRHPAGFFEGLIPHRTARFAYRLRAENAGGMWELCDPYAFGPVLGTLDEHLLVEGTHRELYERLGAHVMSHEGAVGVHFAVWAPNARRVSVVGDFNAWDGRRHQMRKRIDSGLWEIFAPDLGEGAVYKYEIVGPDGALQPLKADPLGFGSELRPSTASIVARTDRFTWADGAYLEARDRLDPRRAPMAAYEVHLGSWRRRGDGGFLSYDELADQLVSYAADMGFTHLELLPVSEHPLDASWGYQPIGLFSPTRRFGDPAGFARFVDRAHQAGLGVILDWVPAHFPTDVHGLARFDGTHLYEHSDPRRGFHPDWNTAIFDYGRREVANFLFASALYWLDRFHIDGLRVDAVASMLYLDYSRKPGEWLPNPDGSNDNRDAAAFLRRCNELAYGLHPGTVTIAEESTAWAGVSQPAYAGGLGFGFKWNMGWMHDTLEYMARDPVHRRWHHNKMTFGLLYAFSENFVLPLSHDEVVHGKGSIIGKMPGDEWQKFANARAYYGFMWAHPGKKLLFMGQEFGQIAEWNFNYSLDWHVLEFWPHAGLKSFVRDLNRVYRATPALHARDCESEGFRWISADDQENSVYAWLRFGGPGDRPVAVVSNFTPVPRYGYRIGLPHAGRWREILNSDATFYGGSGMGNLGAVSAEPIGAHGLPASAAMLLPPLGTLYLEFVGD